MASKVRHGPPTRRAAAPPRSRGGRRRSRPSWDLEVARAHLRRADPGLARLIRARPDFDPRAWLADLPAFDAFGALTFQIIGQQLSVVATRRILERIEASFDGRIPTPEQVLASKPAVLRSAGLSQRKVGTIRTVAAAFADGTVSDRRLRKMTDEEIQTTLTAIPGIGPWTVQGLLIIALDRPDVVLPGDLALRKAIQRQYGLDHLPSPDEVLGIAEPWRPYRTLATGYIFQSAFEGGPG
jgi:DNA-3-methyladenine glycosylase II